MSTLLVTHSACLGHETPMGHPECADRLRAVLHALEGEEFQYLMREEAPRAKVEDLTRVHSAAYVTEILARVPAQGFEQIDADTVLSSGSGEAALRAAGAVTFAVDRVITGTPRNAFCAIRPPGHHAEPDTAMGFCLFNNVAVGALYAREVHGAHRAAVIDFDVHHGNGTQTMFEKDAGLFYASSHQAPFYPGTGDGGERGMGNILNVPLAEGASGDDFRGIFADMIVPALVKFQPDIIFISAGFDGHMADPLAGLNLTEADYVWATQELMRVADKLCDGRIVSTLEGGYDLVALAKSASAHVRALMGV